MAEWPINPDDWMFRCDFTNCGIKFPAHEDLRGTGNAGRIEGQRRARLDGWEFVGDQGEIAGCPAHADQLFVVLDEPLFGEP